MPYVLLTLVLVAADQLVKYLVRTNIPLGTSLPFLPGIMELTYWQNTGAAFSLFSEHTWVLTLISAVVSLVILGVLVKRVVAHPFGVAALSVVLAGAVGNLIDRVAFGYVTDMFNFQFMRFAVFNVADVCVVCGGIAFCIYFLFFYDKLEKKEGDGDDARAADR
ncbi:MAG TPA: signal peptidase II [Candidatus Intestinimonas stercoravium]|nr:signal peptidase II [Candidatus Intestinimonas stercoravium]